MFRSYFALICLVSISVSLSSPVEVENSKTVPLKKDKRQLSHIILCSNPEYTNSYASASFLPAWNGQIASSLTNAYSSASEMFIQTPVRYESEHSQAIPVLNEELKRLEKCACRCSVGDNSKHRNDECCCKNSRKQTESISEMKSNQLKFYEDLKRTIAMKCNHCSEPKPCSATTTSPSPVSWKY